MTLEQLRISGLLEPRHHLHLWEANELISLGVPGELVASITRLHSSGADTVWFWKGVPVMQCVAVVHFSLIHALGNHFGVDPEIGGAFTGRGFVSDAICEVLNEMVGDHN
jgi:hypothetical protein